MRNRHVIVLGLIFASGALGCSDDPPTASAPADEVAAGPDVDTSKPASDADAANDPLPEEPEAPGTPSSPGVDAGVDAGPPCKKHLTVIFTVGVPGKSKMKTNGCWTPVIADGAAVKEFRKCSTSNFVVSNATGTAWAYDDTNPAHPLTQEKNFLASCAGGTTTGGYEYMAYRGGWRLLGAPGLKAYFAELYGSSLTDIDSLYYVSGVYRSNAALAAHKNVYPMMNFGPPKSANLQAKVEAETLKLCKPVADGGYFGAYNASWQDGMEANDARLLAFQRALDSCTGK
jgi:hypothetical protein